MYPILIECVYAIREGRQPHQYSVWLPDHNFHWKLFVVLHFTCMSSVPHLSTLPPNFFNFKCFLYANRKMIQFFGDVVVSITTWICLSCIFSLHKHVYWLPGAIVARIPIKPNFCVKYDLRQCAHPGCFQTASLFYRQLVSWKFKYNAPFTLS